MVTAQFPPPPARLTRLVFALGLAIAAALVPARAAAQIDIVIDASKTGPKIDRQIFGQFAEHLGSGVYEGIWVGPDSPIPNTRGIRNDVVAALKALKVPNVRWPGGCFADDYHWRKGIGPAGQRTFGTLMAFRAATTSLRMPRVFGMGDPGPTQTPS